MFTNENLQRKKITVAVVGSSGKMGQIALSCIEQMPDYTVVAKVGRADNLAQVLQQSKPDIAIELTSNQSVLNNSRIIIQNGVRPLIGSSGLVANDIQELTGLCVDKNIGGLIIPNFSLGVACVNKFATMIKPYFDDFSVVEFHHRQKKDKPSGTARHLTQLLGTDEGEIASIRADGFVAKLQLYANTPHERLIIDHESFDRKSFIPGIKLSLSKILEQKHLVYGLENLII